ncbi:hypothetical protein AGMMS50276_33170 [Synergistales bacterium]|nr:hypothetical protein AGMMS50276_33170 [Synergistales bacterium]
MTVYFEPQGKSWLDYVAPIAQQALGGLVQGMFERDSNARNLKIEERKAAEASERKRQEEAIRQQRAQELLGNLNLTDREKAGYSLGLFSPEIAPYIDKISQQFNPHQAPIQLDLGDRVKSMSFDPKNGTYLDAAIDSLGLNPKEIEQTRREVIKEKAANYRAGMRVSETTADKQQTIANDPLTNLPLPGYETNVNNLRKAWNTAISA